MCRCRCPASVPGERRREVRWADDIGFVTTNGDEPVSHATRRDPDVYGQRLDRLRRQLRQQTLDGFFVPRSDEHLSEYVPASAERLAWLTGFTGSAGLAVVLPDRAAAFTDGRYVLQMAKQVDGDLWEHKHITDEPPPRWLAANAPQGAKIGYDPMLISEEGLARYLDLDFTMVAVDSNPIDAIWSERPSPPLEQAVPHPVEYAGRPAEDKRAQIATLLREAGQDAAVISDPACIAWLFNIRGADVPFTPFALGFALMHADGNAELFMDPVKLPEATRAWLGNAVSVSGREALAPALSRLKGRRVRVDASGTPVWFSLFLRDAGAVVVAEPDPCLLPKACKNPVEQEGARSAHARDAVAVCRFLRFLAERAGNGTETEQSVAAQLLALRARAATFRGRASRPSRLQASTAPSYTIGSPMRATGRYGPTRSISSIPALSTSMARRISRVLSGPAPISRHRPCENRSPAS